MGEAITKSTRWSGSQAHHKIPVEVVNNSPLLQRLEKQGLFKLNGKGNGIMLPESLSKETTRSKHKGYHRGYNQAIMEIVDNIDKNSKCDRERKLMREARKRGAKIESIAATRQCAVGVRKELERWEFCVE